MYIYLPLCVELLEGSSEIFSLVLLGEPFLVEVVQDKNECKTKERLKKTIVDFVRLSVFREYFGFTCGDTHPCSDGCLCHDLALTCLDKAVRARAP